MATVNLPFLSVPLKTIAKGARWPFRQLAGTPGVERRVVGLEGHVAALTEVVQIMFAQASAEWRPELRLEVQRHIASFTIEPGLSGLRPSGNPVTSSEIERLKEYVSRAQAGGTFTAEEATDLKDLSERAAAESKGQVWGKDLLALGIFIFSVYALSRIFSSSKDEGEAEA